MTRGIPEEGGVCSEEDARQMMKTPEVARLLDVDHRTVLVWVRDKGLPCYRVPGTSGKGVSYFFRWAEVEGWLERVRKENNCENQGTNDNRFPDEV